MPRNVTNAVVSDPRLYEDKHVHAVYDQIASHFSSTRYKPWPIIAAFLSNLPTGWVGLDSGTGNGKYLPLPLDRPGSLWTIGLDRSRNLLDIAKTAGGGRMVREVVWGDVLGNGWRCGAFDYALSIATIHHLATQERRQLAIQRLIQCVSPKHGRILIYVWAIEQDEFSKRSIPCDQQEYRTGQDVFVPWVLSQQKAEGTRESKMNNTGPEPPVFNRYYHMFAQGELVELASKAASVMGLCVGPVDVASVRGVEIVQNGWERSNYYVELRCWEC